MFATNRLIHYLFADMHDTYYTNGLLALTFEQYLWLQLHENGYQAVYFLRKNPEYFYTFATKTYGDVVNGRAVANYEQNFFLGFSKASKQCQEMGRWMADRLNPRKKQTKIALVCPLQDFCEIMQNDKWQKTLENLAAMQEHSGILILTAPVFVGNTTRLLLESPVFNTLNDRAVLQLRKQADDHHNGIPGIYSELEKNLSDTNACYFMNIFGKEQVRNCLLRVCIECPERDCDLDLAADFLTCYLNDEKVQHAFQVLEQENLPNLSFHSLHNQLKLQSCWNKLTCVLEKAEQAGSVQKLLEQEGVSAEQVEIRKIRIQWDSTTIQGRCARMCIPKKYRETAFNGNTAESVLCEIHRLLTDVSNRKENHACQKTLERCYKAADNSADQQNWVTYRRALEAIRFCLKQLYTEERSEKGRNVETICDMLVKDITLSDEFFQLQQEIEEAQNVASMMTDQTALKLQQKRLEQMKTNSEFRKKELDMNIPLIAHAIAELEISRNFRAYTDQFSENLLKFQSRIEQEKMELQELTQEKRGNRQEPEGQSDEENPAAAVVAGDTTEEAGKAAPVENVQEVQSDEKKIIEPTNYYIGVPKLHQ